MSTNVRGQVSTTPALGPAAWAGDVRMGRNIVAGGFKIDNTAFGAADAFGFVTVPSGTVIGRTRAERTAGTPMGPAADTDEEFFITAFDVKNALTNDDVECVKPFNGFTVKENFLPTALTALSATVQAAIRARYFCTVGVS